MLKTLNVELTSRKFTFWKTIYNHNLLINLLLNNNLYIYYYDFITIEDKNNIQKLLKENNLKMTRVKKKTLLDLNFIKEYFFLTNLLINNVLIITSKDNNFIYNKQLFTNFQKIKTVHLIGVWLSKKIYRPFEFKKLTNLSLDIKKNTIIILVKQLYLLKLILNKKTQKRELS